MNDDKMREVVIWLAGVLSCDGHVSRRGGKTLTFHITSTELGWLQQIKQRLLEVGIGTNFQEHSENAYNLYIQRPFDVRTLLLKYAKPYMMSRKLRLIEAPYSPRHAFSIEERQTIEEEVRKGRNSRQIAAKIGRSHMGIAKYLRRRGIRPKA